MPEEGEAVLMGKALMCKAGPDAGNVNRDI